MFEWKCGSRAVVLERVCHDPDGRSRYARDCVLMRINRSRRPAMRSACSDMTRGVSCHGPKSVCYSHHELMSIVRIVRQVNVSLTKILIPPTYHR